MTPASYPPETIFTEADTIEELSLYNEILRPVTARGRRGTAGPGALNPGTAFFVGYNYDVQNYDARALGSLPPLARLNKGLINDGRVLFVKLSYLFRY